MTRLIRPSSREIALLAGIHLLSSEAESFGLGAMGDPDTEQDARDAVIGAWTTRYGTAPTPEAAQAVQAIGAHEGQYGRGWKDHASPLTGYWTGMEGSYNWGAVQCVNCKPVEGVCCDGCGYWYDSRPTADGQQYYEQCFKRYPNAQAGADGILKILDNMPLVTAVLDTGDLDEIALQMRRSRYYQGFSTDEATAVDAYAGALEKRAATTAAALGDERAAYRKGGAENNPDGYATTDNPDGGPGLLDAAWPIVRGVLYAGAGVVAVVATGKGLATWKARRARLESSAKRSKCACATGAPWTLTLILSW